MFSVLDLILGSVLIVGAGQKESYSCRRCVALNKICLLLPRPPEETTLLLIVCEVFLLCEFTG